MTSGMFVVASAKSVLNRGPSDVGPMTFESQWGDLAGSAGETPVTFDPRVAKRGLGGNSPAQLASYPFGDGRLFGCYRPEERLVQGIWTQASGAPRCGRTEMGSTIWGRFNFMFSRDGRSFDGGWTSCDEETYFSWDGHLQPIAVQAPDLRDPLGMLERLPRCEEPVS